MKTKDADAGGTRRNGRNWHVISEMDLMRLVADHSQLEQMCAALLAGAENTLQLSIRLRDLLDTTIVPHARNEDMWLANRLLDKDGPPIAQALLDAIRTGHCNVIHGCRRLATALEDSAKVPWELVHDFINVCRQSIMLETLAISYLAGHRLTPQARELLECSMVSLQSGRVDA